MSVPKSESKFSKVPVITVYFWIIKILCTTVGETASDFLNVNLSLGLVGTSLIIGGLLALLLFIQFKQERYVPVIYWGVVVFISIFGTLVTDYLTDEINIPLQVTTVTFTVILTLTFLTWYRREKTLSIHSIYTPQREVFYWLVILFTFALGTAVGDLMAESMGLGYLTTGIIVFIALSVVTGFWSLNLNPIITFWTAYILTRPLGASLGDYLSQPVTNGGLGLGTVITSVVFLSGILLTVIYLSFSREDLIDASRDKNFIKPKTYSPSTQIAICLFIVLLSIAGVLQWSNKIKSPNTSQVVISTDFAENLSTFQKIAEETLKLIQLGDISKGKERIKDLESAWDLAEYELKPLDKEKWAILDKAIDKAIRELRAFNPNKERCLSSLESLTSAFDNIKSVK